MKKTRINTFGIIVRGLIFSALVCFLLALPAFAGETEADEESSWVNFFLICNEGMSNRGGNSGNTSMVVSMNEQTGIIRLMMFTWDTFVEYEGYDLPQKLDMAYRNDGPEETVKVFNDNFQLGVDHYMSVNFLNLATLIDAYGGVNVDVTRAERNALNGLVSAKKENIQARDDANLLDQLASELLAKEYYLNEFGPDTHLNGLQAVGFGWLQYDSVYNCCERDVEVIAALFHSVGKTLHEEVLFYDNAHDIPETDDYRRIINLDEMSEEDLMFLRQAISPIFNVSYHNLTEDEIVSITLALAKVSYLASRQGADILDQMQCTIFPLEAKDSYDQVAGVYGHLIDYEANSKAMKEFLYGDDSLK